MTAIRAWGVAAMVTVAFTVAACGVESDDSSAGDQPEAAVAEPATAPTASTTDTCALTPSQTEGPFYFDTGEFRRDITEGLPGAPLLVELRVVDVDACRPLPGAVVDVWQTSPSGQYSGYPNQGAERVDTTGQTFLRGKQTADADGLVQFETVYPGWYEGRTVHIHFMVHAEDRRLVTSQLYFPANVSDAVLQTEPYASRGPSPTPNDSDRIFRDAPDLLGQVTPTADGYAVSLTIGVAP